MGDAVTQHGSIIWWIELLTICQWWNGHNCEGISRQNLYSERLWLYLSVRIDYDAARDYRLRAVEPGLLLLHQDLQTTLVITMDQQ